MIIQGLDLYTAKDIHKKYYEKEFEFPQFGTDTFINKFQITNENDKVITAGGIRLIPEIILMTDKDAPVLDRRLALYTALDYMIYNAKQMNYDGLHAFVQDQKWSTRLKRTGFHNTKGEALVLNI